MSDGGEARRAPTHPPQSRPGLDGVYEPSRARGRRSARRRRSCPTPRRSARACAAARCRPCRRPRPARTRSPRASTRPRSPRAAGAEVTRAVAAEPAAEQHRAEGDHPPGREPARHRRERQLDRRHDEAVQRYQRAVYRGRVAVGDHLQRQRRLLLEVHDRAAVDAARNIRNGHVGEDRAHRAAVRSATSCGAAGRVAGSSTSAMTPKTADVDGVADEDEHERALGQQAGHCRPRRKPEVDREPVGGERGHAPARGHEVGEQGGRGAAGTTPT